MTTESSRRLSSIEELWYKAFEFGTGSNVLGVKFDQVIRLEVAQHALAVVQAQVPITRSRIVNPGNGKLEFRAYDGKNAPTVVLKEHEGEDGNLAAGEDAAESLPLTHQIIEEEVGSHLASVISDGFDVFQVHLHQFGSSNSSLIIFKITGCAMDVHSALRISQAYLTALKEAVLDSKSTAPPTVSNELTIDMTKVTPSVGSKWLLRKGFDALGYVANSKRSALLPFETNISEVPSGKFHCEFVHFNLDVSETQRFKVAIEAEGVTYFGAEVASALKAVASFKNLSHGTETFGITSIVDCRPHLKPPLSEHDVGLFTSGFPLLEKAGESTPFWDLARQLSRQAEDSVAKMKMFTEQPVLDMLFSTALARPSLTPHASGRTSLLTGYVSSPQIATWKGVEELRVLETLGPVVSVNRVGPCIAVLDNVQKGPELHFNLVYPAPLFSRSSVQAIADLMHQNLLAAFDSAKQP